jgi:anti-sigma factor RsiW
MKPAIMPKNFCDPLMNCEICQTELEDFLYGELSQRRAAELRAHLAACAACAVARDTLAREQEIFAQYYEQTALEPSPALWETVRARIRDEAPAPIEEKRGWLSGVFATLLAPAFLRQAAFATALVILSVAATTLYFKSREKERGTIATSITPSPAPTTNPPAPAPTALPDAAPPKAVPVKTERLKQAQPVNEAQLIQNQLARAEREYQSAIKLLDRVIARNPGKLEPGLVKQYESSLALIDNSIAESRRALRERPADAAGGQFLLAAYAKKLELMQDIAMHAGQ